MKIRIQLLLAVLISMALSSCCGMFGGCAKTKAPASQVAAQTSGKVIKENGRYYEILEEHVPSGAKGGIETRTIKRLLPQVEEQECPSCLSSFCPKPGCCGTVGKETLNRASNQGWSGEPHIGLVPTMKVLAE